MITFLCSNWNFYFNIEKFVVVKFHIEALICRVLQIKN